MTETFVYRGIKQLHYPISETKAVTDMIHGVRSVTINGIPLPSVLIQEEYEYDNYRVYDWGVSSDRNLAMNLAASILDYHYKSINIEYVEIYMFARYVIRKLTNTWIITQNEIDPFMSRVHKEFTGETI